MIFRITLNSTEKGAFILPYDPVGWKNIEAVLKRSPQYHGIFYELMAQFEFKCSSGKEYIDDGIFLYGIDWVCSIKIEISCSQGGGSAESLDYSIDYSDDYGSMISGSTAPVFETLFEGTLRLDTYAQTDESTFVDLIQSDFVQKVINRLETKVNIDSLESLDGDTLTQIAGVPYSLTLPSKSIRYGSQLVLSEDAQASPFSVNGNRVYIYHPFEIVYNDLDFNPPIPILEVNNSLIYQPSGLFTAPFTGAYNFNYSLIGGLFIENFDGVPVTYTIQLKYGVNQTGGASTQIGSNFGGIISGPGSATYPFSFSSALSLSLNQGDVFQFYFLIQTGTGNTIITCQYTTADFGSYIDTTTSSTTTDAYYIHEACAAIAQRITGQEDAFRSELLGRKNSQPNSYSANGCFSFTAITGGKKIRNIPDKSDLSISMSEMFKTINSINNAGLGFEKIDDSYVIRIEGKEYFYSTDAVIQLSNCPKIKRSVAKEFYISDIYIGYEKWESEEVNGLDEFNAKHEYNTGIKALESRLELFSPFIASSYAFEFTRRKQYVDFPNVDWKYDNDTFIACLNRSVDGSGNPNNLSTVEKDENYSQINNIFSPESTYNYRISPARNLLRHIKSIAGGLIKYPLRAIRFVYGEGNYLAQTEFTSDSCPGNFENELLSENQDITVEESGETAIWEPEYLEFQYPITFAQYLLVKANPKACIEVSDTESDFEKAFIIDFRYRPVTGLTTFKLLKAYAG